MTKNRKFPEGKFLSNHPLPKKKKLHVTPTRWHLRLLKAALHKHVHRSWIKTGWLHSQHHLPKVSRAHHQTNKIEEQKVNHKSTVFSVDGLVVNVLVRVDFYKLEFSESKSSSKAFVQRNVHPQKCDAYC